MPFLKATCPWLRTSLVRGLAVAAAPLDGGGMGKRETGEEVVRRVGRDALRFLTEAGFAMPSDIEGGLEYTGRGLKIGSYHYVWVHEVAVSAFVEMTEEPLPARHRAKVEELYAECGLGAPNHLPGTAGNARLTEVRVRVFASALRQLLPFLLGSDRDALIRRASAR
ncbi:hypothetical protein ACFZDK_49985 [Streptomyces sp. NPDC007901]|uniref:hypothetical protein n=1 Tax=Streptomyces sp. NPDC007901 TaxID=3364785 RepID=UPI0036E73DBC